jgi:hypothetical protein
MRRDPLEVLIAEAEQLSAKLRELDEDAWAFPTACVPWTVKELLGHIAVTISWLPGMLHSTAPVPTDQAGPAGPADPLVSARDYYRPDPRFSPKTNNRRIELGRQYAARSGGNSAAALAMFEHEWRRAAAMCAAEPEGRIVRTRHGDAILLNDFLVTRVVEVAVHGMDLAAAVHSEPWLTASAADLLMTLLAGDDGADQVRRELKWEPAVFVAKATGREPVSAAERAELDRLGIHWLTFG